VILRRVEPGTVEGVGGVGQGQVLEMARDGPPSAQRWMLIGNALTVVGVLVILAPTVLDVGWAIWVAGAVLVLAGSACVGAAIALARRGPQTPKSGRSG
jgi:hypothetical protein